MERKLELFLETRLVLPELSCGITNLSFLERLLFYSRVRHVLSRSTSRSNLWKEEKLMRLDVKLET
jgi:5-methylcytosine-specific restriction endonuclease McrA